METRVLKEAEAAVYIGMSRSWLRQARMTENPDGPPFVRNGRAVRYLREDLDNWLMARRTDYSRTPERNGKTHTSIIEAVHVRRR